MVHTSLPVADMNYTRKSDALWVNFLLNEWAQAYKHLIDQRDKGKLAEELGRFHVMNNRITWWAWGCVCVCICVYEFACVYAPAVSGECMFMLLLFDTK